MGRGRISISVDRWDRNDDLICAVLRGEDVGWPGDESGLEVEELLAQADFHGIAPLLADRLRRPQLKGRWPEAIQRACRAQALSWVAWDLAQRHETIGLLLRLRSAGLKPLVLKGGAIAYSHYATPGLRPRCDLDLIVAERDKARAEAILRGLGYIQNGISMGEIISSQSSWTLVSRLGAVHNIDLHWRSSNSPILAKLLSFEEMEARAITIPQLGCGAFAPCAVHAMLFACFHRAGSKVYLDHHVQRSVGDRLIWLYDIHLLASRMAPQELEEVVALAVRKRMTAVCRESLLLCKRRFDLQVPPAVMQDLQPGNDDEPSSRFFEGGRFMQMTGDFLALDGPRERIGWLKELAFPSSQYMRSKYSISRPHWLLVLYARRAIEGLWKIATRQ